MSTALQVALFAAALAFTVLVICLVPIIFEARRKLEQLVSTAAELKEKVQALVEDSHEMVRNVTEISKRANQELDEVGHVVQTVRQWTERADRLVNEVGSAIEPPVHSIVRNMNLLRPAPPHFYRLFFIASSPTQPTRNKIMSENNSCPLGGYIATFAVGALIGAGIALLYAPQSGEETRKLIAAKGKELKGKAHDAIEDAREFIDHKKSEITAAVEAGKEAMREERQKHQKNA